MNRIILVLLAFMLSASTLFAQDDSSIPGGAELPKSTFHINPLGLLQFGPVFMYEARLGTGSVYLAPWFRYGYLGVLTHLQWDADKVSPVNLGVGTMIKGYSLNDKGNALYYGGGVEYAIGKANYDVGEQYETEESFTGLGIIANFGHRWIRRSGSFLNVGILTGVVLTLKDEEVYVLDGSLYDSYDDTLFLAMFEVSFGWPVKR